MQRSDFHYRLPPELIAQHPVEVRSASRLLILQAATGGIADRVFTDLPDYLRAGDLLVFNDTRVLAARLRGRKDSGGRGEVLVERLLSGPQVLAQVRASKTPRPGTVLVFAQDVRAEVCGREGAFFRLRFLDERPPAAILEAIGEVPLPPYIARGPAGADRERYQTVYARRPGAVAAPTAGLHFDQALLARLAERGVASTWVTLHVGAGTFQPVRVEDLSRHTMHREWLEVSEQACGDIEAARAGGGRVVAVGTTTVRALETAARSGELRPYRGETDIFIRPGYTFRAVDALLTNFHLPESTLLMLVCAFAGYEPVMQAYRHAVAQRYRFFSYGDAMLVEK